jgi:hypothetical protein
MATAVTTISGGLAPICLFTYNRLSQTQETIESLQKNYLASQSELFVFSDGWRSEADKEKVIEVRKYINSINGFDKITIIDSNVNKGLANSIIDGVTQIIKKYGKVIVLEDDLVSTPNFLDFMNKSLEFYKVSEVVQSISGFSLKVRQKPNQADIYFHRRPFSWGWATWDDRWDKNVFDKKEIQIKINKDGNILKKFSQQCGNDISEMLLDSIDGKNNSWYVRWAFDHFNTKRVTVYPFLSKVYNVGFSEDGTHCNGINVFKTNIDTLNQRRFVFSNQFEYGLVGNEFLKYFSKVYKLKFRLNLLLLSSGRKNIYKEIRFKFFNKFNI